MSSNHVDRAARHQAVVATSGGSRFTEWIQDPMGMTVAASVLTISTFGIVLSGTWLVNLFVN